MIIIPRRDLLRVVCDELPVGANGGFPSPDYIYIYIIYKVHMCICICVYLSLSLYIYIYVYISIYIYICIYIYIYVCIYISLSLSLYIYIHKTAATYCCGLLPFAATTRGTHDHWPTWTDHKSQQERRHKTWLSA